MKNIYMSLLAISIVAGCGSPVIQKNTITPTVTPEEVKTSVLSRDFLLDGYDEDTAASIYGYFLIEPEMIQSHETEKLLEKMARAFWLGLVTGESSAQSKQPSMAYWPIQDIDHAAMIDASLAEKWDVWIQHYHFERAQLVHQRVGCHDTGPILVAAFQPLASMAHGFEPHVQEVLVIDMGLLLPDNYLVCLQTVQQQIFSKPALHAKGWNIEKIKKQLGPWFEERIDQAVFIQKP